MKWEDRKQVLSMSVLSLSQAKFIAILPSECYLTKLVKRLTDNQLCLRNNSIGYHWKVETPNIFLKSG